MKRALIVGLALTTLAVAPALAREDHDSMSSGGLSMGDHATTKLKTIAAQPGDMLSSKLIGLNVYDAQNESIGEIKDIVVKDGKSVAGVVISVGGFLGMGESYVLVSPASITVSDKNNTLKAYVDTTKDALTSAPKFTYETTAKKS